MHAILNNPDVQAQLHSFLINAATLVGTILSVILMQAAVAIKNSHLNMIQKLIAERLVSYAEQTIEGSGQDKAVYVAAQLHDHFPKLDNEQVTHLLEAAVQQMNSTLAKGEPNAK